MTVSILRLASAYGRYGYRRIQALLQSEGWSVGHGRVMRISRREGLRVPQKQPRLSRLWLNDGSCIRLRPQRRNRVWSWDFVFDRTDDGRRINLMAVIDEFARECLTIHVAPRVRAKDAIDVFADLISVHGVAGHVRSDNGPEMIAKNLRGWLERISTRTMHITPCNPWENATANHLTASFGTSY